MEKTLKKIGLTNSEISIYLKLFEIGSATAAKIAEKSKLHRTNAYDYLDRLMKKGFVSCTTKDNIKYFSVTDPNNLLSYIEKKKEDLDKSKQDIKELIIKLRNIKPLEIVPSRIETFQDRAGLESFYEKLIDLSASKDEVLIIGSSKRILEVFDYYLLNLTKKIVDINIKIKMIANKELTKHKHVKIIKNLIDLKMRSLPVEYLSPTAMFIFKDYVGICNFMENPFVILINDASIADSYKQYFRKIWEKSEE